MYNISNYYINTSKEGYVYVLSNPSYDGYYKIGCSTDVKERINKLSSESGVLTPFIEEFKVYVLDMYKAESIIHQKLDSFRYSQNKEFFKADIKLIKKAFGCLFSEYDTILFKLKDSALLSGNEYYKDNYIEFLDSSFNTLKKNNYNFEYYVNIFKKNGKYYWAMCYTEICSEPQYQKWVNSKKILDSDDSSKFVIVKTKPV